MNKLPIEKVLIIIVLAVFAFALVFLMYLFTGRIKSLDLVFPIGGEEFAIGETYEISWRARNIGKVGIVLFRGTEPKWIAKDIDGSLGRYEWKIQPGERYGDNYWLAVFEYPYMEGNKIAYSEGPFSIVFLDVDTCDSLSIANERPYLPISYPDIRRVFVTEGTYTGELGNLESADQICQSEANKLELSGNWIAFIGGDRDSDAAVQRLLRTEKGTSGVFVEAISGGELSRGDTCHRLISNDFQGFLNLFSSSEEELKTRLSESFFNRLLNIWVGRISLESRRNCLEILTSRQRTLAENYSYTVTCQNWSTSRRLVEQYPGEEFPTCYTPEGIATDAVGIGALSFKKIGGELKIQGTACADKQRILCVER